MAPFRLEDWFPLEKIPLGTPSLWDLLTYAAQGPYRMAWTVNQAQMRKFWRKSRMMGPK